MNSLSDIADKEWEVLVIGGGIFGAATARDATLRGFKTALVERNDFASGTSSRSTKLVHGGIRYLEQFHLGLVHECLRERTTLLTIAPHLVRPLPFLIPVFKGDRYPLPVIQFGVWIYSKLAGKNALRKYECYSAHELKSKYSFLKDAHVTGGVRYFDAQMDDIRLCLETVLSAQAHGAQVANHVEVTRIGLRSDGKFEVSLQDRLTKAAGKARAQSIVNAAGPWADQLLSYLAPRHRPMLSLSKGIHLIIKQKISDDAIALSSSDKRLIFLIPWRNGSIIGTTDTPFRESLDEVLATGEEIDFLLREIKKMTGGFQINRSDIITTFAGIRNLAAVGGKNTAKTSRTHLIHETLPRFFSVVGGKYTTHRLIGEEVCDRLEKSLQKVHVPCKTADLPLLGSFDLPSEELNFGAHPDLSGISKHVLESLMRTYGRRMRDIVRISNRHQDFQKPICPHHTVIGAQVIFAIEQELAKTLMDVCVRRLRLDQMTCRGLDCVHKIANLMSGRLQWTSAKKDSEILEYQNWVRKNTEFLQ